MVWAPVGPPWSGSSLALSGLSPNGPLMGVGQQCTQDGGGVEKQVVNARSAGVDLTLWTLRVGPPQGMCDDVTLWTLKVNIFEKISTDFVISV